MRHITDLEKKLKQADEAYYNTGNPIMSDQEYDALREKFAHQNNNRGAKNAHDYVGSAPSGKLPQVKHDHPMLSLDKIHSKDEIVQFAGKDNLIGMLKMDGLTVSASYKDGILTKLETRGNGEIGNDVMIHAPSFVNLPARISPDIHSLTVDGECIITYDDFEQINKNDEFANPRNLAAGTLNTLDPKISAPRKLRFIAWDVIECDGVDLPTDFGDILHSLSTYGFDYVPYVNYVLGESNIDECIELLRNDAKRMGYPIDGLVFTYADNQKRRKADRTSHHFKHSLAYKFEDDVYPTILRDVEWTMGKIGTLTPVAVFDPVIIDGTEVTRASMHNVSVMRDLNPHIGGYVYVYKANQIIPQLHHCDHNGEPVTIPDTCPVCGDQTSVVKENASVVLTCINPSCPGKMLGRMSTFVSKNGMNIDGLSTEKLRTLLIRGFIKRPIDIYSLKNHKELLENQISGWGKKSVANLLNSIEKARSVKLPNFITALSLPNIGYSQAKTIASHCKDVHDFTNLLSIPQNLLSVDGIGAKTVKDIATWMKTDENAKEMFDLIGLLKFEDDAEVKQSGDSLKGYVFCITGTLKHFANRDALISDIEAHGGRFISDVTKKVTCLINNDVNSTTGKNRKAQKLNIPVIDEEEYLRLRDGKTS